MNREILFRGKRVDNGEWVEGSLIDWGCDGNQVYIIPFSKYATSLSLAQWVNSFGIAVIPETVGQYTGLTDKNGTKIFDGDILRGYKYPYLSEGHFNYYAEVIYFENCPAFGLYTFKNPNLDFVSGISHGNTDFMEDWECENWEVIGNIFDNHELMEEKE